MRPGSWHQAPDLGGEGEQATRRAQAFKQLEPEGADGTAIGEDFPRRSLNQNSLALLRFADQVDKSIDQFLSFAKERGITQSRQRVRAFLHQYKATYGLLASDRDGFFRLSEKGVAYLASLEHA
jgi:hypothetical protein